MTEKPIDSLSKQTEPKEQKVLYGPEISLLGDINDIATAIMRHSDRVPTSNDAHHLRTVEVITESGKWIYESQVQSETAQAATVHSVLWFTTQDNQRSVYIKFQETMNPYESQSFSIHTIDMIDNKPKLSALSCKIVYNSRTKLSTVYRPLSNGKPLSITEAQEIVTALKSTLQRNLT